MCQVDPSVLQFLDRKSFKISKLSSCGVVFPLRLEGAGLLVGWLGNSHVSILRISLLACAVLAHICWLADLSICTNSSLDHVSCRSVYTQLVLSMSSPVNMC